MNSHNGTLYRIDACIKSFRTRALWKSQRKQLLSIGEGSSVLDLPIICGYKYISIGSNFTCGKDIRIEAWDKYGTDFFNPIIKIGDNVTFTDRCYLSCINHISIGDSVLLGRDVFITDNSHGDSIPDMIQYPPIKRPLTSKGPVKIGKNVWIGRQVTVLSGVTIGDNSIIGANSVVNRDIPANCVAAGNPAKVVKEIR